MARVVVIGGGLGGMAAAARLAKLGHEVTLCERSPRLGGAIGHTRAEGFTWDAGPTTTTLPAVLRDLFRKSGRPLDRELELVPLQPVRRHRFADGTELAMPGGSRAAELDGLTAALGRETAEGWTRFVDSLAPVWEAVRRHGLETPTPLCRDLDRPTRRLLAPRRSLLRLAHRSFSDPRLRALLLHPTRLAGSDPRRTPGFVAVEAYVERTFGVWTPVGGMAALVEALTHRLAQRRVDVRLEAEVAQVVCEAGAVAAVTTTGNTVVPADVVVAGIDPRRLFGALVDAPEAQQAVRRMGRLPAAVPPAVTHLGLASGVPKLTEETVLHGDPLLVLRPGGMAPTGSTAWTLLHRGATDVDPLAVLADRGIDVRSHVLARVDRFPADITAELGGSPYGIAWRGARTVAHRPTTQMPIRGLYCVGAGAHPGAGVPLVGLGAALAADLVGKA